MMAEPSALAAAAARKRADALTRAQGALGELAASGRPVSFQALARAAGVSRQWLYTQPRLRGEIERLRELTARAGAPAAERASDASLRQRLMLLGDENRRLREENRALREELALAYGARRALPPRSA